MQLPAQADLKVLNDLAEKMRVIEPPAAEECDGSDIERDRNNLIAAILGIVVAVKNFTESLQAYKQHWPKGPRGRWSTAFGLVASSLGSSTRTLYRFLRSVATGDASAQKGRRKVKRLDVEGKAELIEDGLGREFVQNADRIVKTATEDLKEEFGHALVRQLCTRANVEPRGDLVDRLCKMIDMSLPGDGDVRTEEARRILIAIATRLGVN